MEGELLTATGCGDIATVKKLVNVNDGVNLEATDWLERTALMEAARGGRKDIADFLLSHGANIEALDWKNWTALMWAAYNGEKNVVELLLTHRANLGVLNNNCDTALTLAAQNGHKDIVEVLISFGAKISSTNNYGRTAVMLAALNGHKEVVELLILCGANINSKDNYGQTAQMLAASNDHKVVIDFLTNSGTHPKHNLGKTVLDLARLIDNQETAQLIENATRSLPANGQAYPTNPQTRLIPVLPLGWSTHVDEETQQRLYFNSVTKEQLQHPPLAYPLLQDPSYGTGIAFYDEATKEDVTCDGSSIDFENGVRVTINEGVVPPKTSVTFKAQPAFAAKEVFVLPPGIESASPTYLLSSSSQSLDGNMTLTMEHFVKLQTEDDAKKLVFLNADSSSSSSSSTYHFKQVQSGHPSFKPGKMEGTISTNQFGFWKIGKRFGVSQDSNSEGNSPQRATPPSLYTVRVYRSPENSGKSVAIVSVSYLHRLYAKFLDYLDKELIPSYYPEVSTKKIDQIIEEPLSFEGKEIQIQASSTPGWSFNFDKTSITKRNADLPEELQVKPEELHTYPPKIVCRFLPSANAPKETSCTLTILGLDRPITVSLPLFSPKREVDTEPLKNAVFNLRVTAKGIKKSDLLPTAEQIASAIENIVTILSASSNQEELAQHTKNIHDKVLELVSKAKEVSEGCRVQYLNAQLLGKLPELEEDSSQFNQVATEHICHITSIAEEEKLLAEFIVTGTKLVTIIEEVVESTERLSSIAGLDIENVDDTTNLDEDNDTADILKELSGLEFEYYTLGIHLGLPPGKVKEVKENNPHNCNTALGQVISEWLMMNYEHNKVGKPSWRLLVEAVSTVNLEQAKIIASNHRKVSIIEEGSDRSYEESSTSEESTTFQVEDNIQQEPDQEETEKDKLQDHDDNVSECSRQSQSETNDPEDVANESDADDENVIQDSDVKEPEQIEEQELQDHDDNVSECSRQSQSETNDPEVVSNESDADDENVIQDTDVKEPEQIKEQELQDPSMAQRYEEADFGGNFNPLSPTAPEETIDPNTDVTAVKQQLDSLVLVYLHEFCLSIEGQVSAMRTEMLSLMEIITQVGAENNNKPAKQMKAPHDKVVGDQCAKETQIQAVSGNERAPETSIPKKDSIASIISFVVALMIVLLAFVLKEQLF